MSVVIETTLGDITVDLFLNHRPRACLNFLKLCKIKYYNYNLFHTISRGFIAQTGDPTGNRKGGHSIFGVIDGASKRYFEAENEPRIKHTHPGLISFVGDEDNMIGSQFFLTLGEDLTYLDEKHCVFGEVVEGIDTLEAINEVICDTDDRPYQDVRITHTVVLDDPYPDPKRIPIPSRSPSPSAERLSGGRIAPDEEIDETTGKSAREIAEWQAEREAKARATILEMIGDIPDVDVAPPENVLFVCKLNPVTTDDDLEIIFSRFGKIKSCEVIRDRKSGESLQYAFIEFETQKSCEDAYFKMDNVLIDERRIHVDFSQSVSKVKWLGKGRGVTYYDDKGKKSKNDGNNDIGKGYYKVKNDGYQKNNNFNNDKISNKKRNRSRSPRKQKSPDRRRRRISPDERTKKRYSPKRQPELPRRSRSPRRYHKHDNLEKTNYVGKRSRSPKYRKSPRPKTVDTKSTKGRSNSFLNKYSRDRDISENSSKRLKNNDKTRSREEKSNKNIKKMDQSYLYKNNDKPKSREEERTKQIKKVHQSHSTKQSEERVKKNKKRKKTIESSSYSSDSSSSEEEKIKKSIKKKSKRENKKKIKNKKYYSSSSESSSSDSDSSSSDSESSSSDSESSSSDSEDYKKKKRKRSKKH